MPGMLVQGPAWAFRGDFPTRGRSSRTDSVSAMDSAVDSVMGENAKNPDERSNASLNIDF